MDKITITIDMQGRRIDMSAAGEIPVEELAASLKKAGVRHLTLNGSSGSVNPVGEKLVLDAVLEPTVSTGVQSARTAPTAAN